MRKAAVFGLALAGLLAWTPTLRATVLESSAQDAVLSGLGFISGWKCHAGTITVVIDGNGEHLSVAMHQERGDLRSVCGGTIRHGFIKQLNWALLGDGAHVVVAYDDGVEFDRATFTVGSTGEEFVEGVRRRTVVDGFPAPGERALLEWNESTQHFEIRYVWGSALAGVYDQAYWRQYIDAGRQYDLGRRTCWEAEFLYAQEPDVDRCFAGRLTQAAKDRALEAMNQIRALHHLSPVQYSSRYDQQVQEASLIQAANGSLSHYPEPSAKCYSQARAEGSRGNLSAGSAVDRDWNADPAREMVGWANDARNRSRVEAVGHRRWMLNPFAVYVSYGQVHGFAAQKVSRFDAEPVITPQIEVEYVAFPYEIYPFPLVEGDPPWSFSVIEDKSNLWGNQHPYFDHAIVTVARVYDGIRLTVNDLYTDTRGSGVPNVLSWQVEGWDYDTLYEVEISNVAMQSGDMRSFSYQVFIERDELEG